MAATLNPVAYSALHAVYQFLPERGVRLPPYEPTWPPSILHALKMCNVVYQKVSYFVLL